jgi:VWFA-related protein
MMSLRTRASVPIAMMAIVIVMARAEIGSQEPYRFGERVRVDRIIVDARVLDDQGNPVLGLTADDFNVRVNGKLAHVETATWIGERGPETRHEESAPLSSQPPASRELAVDGPLLGRLVVFLFQKDLEPGRVEGLLQMLLRSRDFLATLTPADRVAILSFDSHLKIWTDFTNDRQRLERVLARGLLFETAAAVQSSSAPSLMERLGAEQAKRTYGIERALELLGEALQPLPGSKALVLVGYGFGRLSLGGVLMENDYEAARRTLLASRTSVFSLDVTNADYHSLEAGLQLVSEQTGGFYARTHLFPAQAMRRLSGALAGYYALFIERPDGHPGRHEVSVKLTRRSERVLATSSYLERDE